jgi:Lrp/AsnC family leucine-responsive transcriptional regulator
VKEIDQQICRILQENGRLSLSEVAEMIGSSVPTVSEHVKKMDADGTIIGYHAVIDPKAAGLDVAAFVFVDVDTSMNYDSFRKQCRLRKEILEVHAITGTSSHMMKIRVENTNALEQLLSAIQRWKGVTRTLTNVVLSTHKETTNLPL